MGRPGSGIKKTIRKYAKSYEIIRYDRETTTYIDGILQPVDNEKEFIKIHIQPLGDGKLISDLPEGQRLKDVNRGWTLEKASEKDKLIIDGKIHTINAVQKWPESNHIECDIIRTGEKDNIYVT